MRVNNKKGQIFLFAAVIICVIVLSMATITNYAHVRNEPKNFYDYHSDVQRESNEVLDYAVYKGFSDGSNISNFVSMIADDLRDKDANANFMFVYGDNTTLIVENYGEEVASIAKGQTNILIPGSSLKIGSSISVGNSYSYVTNDYNSLGGTGSRATLINVNRINITILNNTFSFPIGKDKQVIFMVQKEDGGETYVSA